MRVWVTFKKLNKSRRRALNNKLKNTMSAEVLEQRGEWRVEERESVDYCEKH